MSYVFGLLTLIIASTATAFAASTGEAASSASCCETMPAIGDFWNFKRQRDGDCALNINMFDNLKLITALQFIDCKDFNTLIINGQHMTEPFVASDEDLAAIPEHTNVVYENIQSAQIEKEETGTNMKSLNLVGSEDFKFHPSLLDETEFIEFDGVKLTYNSDERVFKLTQTETGKGNPRAESLISSSAKGPQLSDFEVLLSVICGVQLLVILMIVAVSCSARQGQKGEFKRTVTSTSLGSEYSQYSQDSADYEGGPSRKISTISSVSSASAVEDIDQPHECTVMIDETEKS